MGALKSHLPLALVACFASEFCRRLLRRQMSNAERAGHHQEWEKNFSRSMAGSIKASSFEMQFSGHPLLLRVFDFDSRSSAHLVFL